MKLFNSCVDCLCQKLPSRAPDRCFEFFDIAKWLALPLIDVGPHIIPKVVVHGVTVGLLRDHSDLEMNRPRPRSPFRKSWQMFDV